MVERPQPDQFWCDPRGRVLCWRAAALAGGWVLEPDAPDGEVEADVGGTVVAGVVTTVPALAVPGVVVATPGVVEAPSPPAEEVDREVEGAGVDAVALGGVAPVGATLDGPEADEAGLPGAGSA